jgi:hypothetical protein
VDHSPDDAALMEKFEAAVAHTEIDPVHFFFALKMLSGELFCVRTDNAEKVSKYLLFARDFNAQLVEYEQADGLTTMSFAPAPRH